MKQFKQSDFSPEHKRMIEMMKDQLLIVLINRLGGQIDISVAEIDATGQFNLAMKLDPATKVFHFEVRRSTNRNNERIIMPIQPTDERAEAATDPRGGAREPIANARAEKAEADAARRKDALVKVEAWMSGEDGPLCKLWEDGDIGNYDDVPPTDWEQTLFDIRDWKHGSVPTASLGHGTEWPAIKLYREILAALEAPEAAREGEANEL